MFLWAKHDGAPGGRPKRLKFANGYEVLPTRRHRSGYLVLNLPSPIGRSGVKVHRIVAECWYGLKPSSMDTAHKDGNRLNNAPDNLMYCSRSANMKHKVAHGTSGVCPAVKACRASLRRGRSMQTCNECGAEFYRESRQKFCSRDCRTKSLRKKGKLTAQSVAEIRRLVASGESTRAAARRFSVSPATIWRICRGVDWA